MRKHNCLICQFPLILFAYLVLRLSFLMRPVIFDVEFLKVVRIFQRRFLFQVSFTPVPDAQSTER